MTTNQNHPDDHLAIEALHSRYLNVLTGRTSDHLLMFQDEAYALGRARGRLDVFRFDLHLERQRRFSERTFGPGSRAAGVVDHIRKELREIEEAPGDLAEWIDVVILALDGAWRTGATPAQIIEALVAKQTKNEARTWPDWRTVPVDKAIEHDRTGDAPAVAYSDPRSGEITWSANGEDWHNEDLSELITSYDELQAGSTVYFGTKRYLDPAGFVDPDSLISSMNDNASCSDAGEWVDDWPQASKEAMADLGSFLRGWARANCPPDFYLVDGVTSYTLTEADIQEARGE
ncbi:dATP/dGTP pyrophosphohydrolase domain-containing protein [Pseudomonas aeruginosa]|uniref:dATP/dGTP pyrophosphohydrolase domain-containing protein n=1 Tax=Pseudomonas aeruginosa TaxID=287 RepID=UPI00208FD150|nr:dATP/dGTP pyrophosphohydrolase domain-containing protein [Pseudomonas aeruginosa]MDP5705941.1 DUF550 domain-containing protein [Pseudomonas aeruginosa]